MMWGMVLCCFAVVKNYSGALAVRFFLGVFEAAVSPGFALITSQVRHQDWYWWVSWVLTSSSGTLRKSKGVGLVSGSVSMDSHK